MPESEGWWTCLLHGRQGLAPANRLQILEEAPADGPCPPFFGGLEEAPGRSQENYEVPSPPTPGPVYEQMKSWVEGPPPPTVQIYEFPDPPTCARIVCEKTLSFPKQVSCLQVEESAQGHATPWGLAPPESRGPPGDQAQGGNQMVGGMG